MDIKAHLQQLRQHMAAHGIGAYLIPSSDPHQSEYLSAHWQSRAWLSGFTGSAGILVITADHAGLWTDSRYFIQAARQLEGSSIALHQQQIPHAPEHIAWLRTHLAPGSTIGMDGRLFSLQQARYLEKQLAEQQFLFDYTLDLITPIWENRPPLPAEPIFEHDISYAGLSRTEKLGQVRQLLAEKSANSLLCCTLDDIAWVLNLRGNDVECNPFFLAYLLVLPSEVILYADALKMQPRLRDTLAADGIILRPYAAIENDLENLPASIRILVDPAGTSIQLYACLSLASVTEAPNPIALQKALKNTTEIHHIKQAMRKDGVALLRLFRWLESCLQRGEHCTEYTLSETLRAFRAEQPLYRGESFPAIIGYRANGAIIHYRPEPDHAAAIQPEGILLLDSGGQYLDGTTDITRTIPLGLPDAEQKRHYTLVLKGHIALADARFPEGTVGMQLDTLARLPLWKQGLSYGHGTGHGVGFFLGVHEGPNGFAASAATSRGNTPFQAGMLTSNEPGFYLEGAYGIRIENLVLCVPAPEDGFLQFETISLFPIDTRLIEPAMLEETERAWLNDYHQKVFEQLAPLLHPDEQAWLRDQCRPI